MPALEKVSNEELLSVVNDKDRYFWGGYDHGDTIAKYQAKLAERYAAALLLLSREMLTGAAIMSQEDAKNVFFDILRYHDARLIEGESGTSRFLPDVLLNHWKIDFQGRNFGI